MAFIKRRINNELSIFEFSEIEALGQDIVHAFIGKDFNYNKHILNNGVIQKKYETICNMFSLDKLVVCNQKHTNNVLIIKNNEEIRDFNSQYFDAIITNVPKVGIAIFTADCQPILLYDKKKKVVAAVHSGWRGTLNKIIINTINKMVSEFSCNTENIICVIGPIIQKCHFEVDKDVADLFINKFHEILDFHKVGDKHFIDIVKLNIYLLNSMGVENKNIFNSEICTVCGNSDFNSYRIQKTRTQPLSNRIKVEYQNSPLGRFSNDQEQIINYLK